MTLLDLNQDNLFSNLKVDFFFLPKVNNNLFRASRNKKKRRSQLGLNELITMSLFFMNKITSQLSPAKAFKGLEDSLLTIHHGIDHGIVIMLMKILLYFSLYESDFLNISRETFG